MKALKKVVRGVTLAELWATALTFVIMVVCYFISVVNRNFIKGSMPWTEELALYCMVYMALIGTELGLRDGTQVSVTALTEKLKGTMVGKVINFIAKVALIVFSCTMLRYSVALVAKQMSAGQTTPVMKVPMYVIYISLVISFALIVINQILMLVGEMMHIDMSDITNIDAIIDGIIKKKEAKVIMNAGVILFLIFAVCVLIGVPISMSLGIGSLAAVALGNLGVSPAVIAQRVFGGLQSTSIMAIAFFILAGNLMAGGGISRRIVNFANCLIGNIRGGMSVALVIACAFFAALSGSAPATVVAIGSMLYADMVKQGYPEDRTAGLLVIAGGLGPVIPPSIIMVLYCTLTGASVTNMFSQGMVIGILIMIVLILEALYYAHKEKWPKAETKHTAGEIGKIFLEAVPALLTPVIILGGIYSGLLTATESAAVACVWAFIAGVFIYKEIKIADLIPILMKSAKSAAMILFIIAASTAFSWVFTFSGASAALVQLVVSMNLNKTLFCLVVAIILLIFGTFMEGTAIAVLLVPVLWPIAASMGINVIHFGMILCISNVIGTMTPPVAVNIFSAVQVTRSVRELKIGEISKAEIPFFIGYVAVFFLCVFSETFCTFLIR